MDEKKTPDNSAEGSTEIKQHSDCVQPTPSEPKLNAPPVSFKTRVKDAAIAYAHDFEDYYINHEYLIFSEAFENAPYYRVQAYGVQYKHLVGVGMGISPANFYEKSLNGTLTENDISFEKKGQTEAMVKGSIRRKIQCFSGLMRTFESGAYVEEGFEKNSIRCSFASGGFTCTIGFSVSYPARPMTLLKGNELDSAKAKPLSLVLRKNKDESKFSEVYVGDVEELKKHKDSIKDLISDELLELIKEDDHNA